MPDPLSERPTQHLHYIDALRGVAIALVIMVHLAGMMHLVGFVGKLLAIGGKGVQLFYVVSALTLMMSMKKRTYSEENPLISFFLRRLFRIAPAFYVVLLIYCFVGWHFGSGITNIQPTSPLHALIIMSFLNGWRPDVINAPVTGQWSIAVEMMFYVLLPLIFPLLTSFRRAVYAWWVSLALYVVSYTLAVHLVSVEGFTGSQAFVHDFAYWWFPSQMPIFMIGIGLYFIVTEKLPFRRYILPYLLGALIVSAIHHLFSNVGLLPVVGVSILIGVVAISRNPVQLIVNPFTRFLGKISFSAYLCHPLILPLVGTIVSPLRFPNVGLRFVLSYALVLALVCPIALLMWTWIEEPCQRLGRSAIKTVNLSSSRQYQAQ
jgi:peptidoglycan/LPS O-acetylase OafA/YrhL